MNSATQIIPDLSGENTQAQVYEQGITYDQAGITYDNVGIAYGGVYNTNEDVVPLVSLAENISPFIAGYSDMYSQYVPPAADHGMLIGMLGLTYP